MKRRDFLKSVSGLAAGALAPTAPAISRGLLDHPEEPAPDKKSWNFFGLRG